MFSKLAIEKFENKIIYSPDCWIFPNKSKSGYGHILLDGKVYLTHRASYEIYIGNIPKGLFVLHECDNPPCVNPDHLFLGTSKDNAIDAAEKGRHHYHKNPELITGELHPNAKLTEIQVLEIRKLYLLGGITQKQLGEKYKVSSYAVFDIINRRSWKHI